MGASASFPTVLSMKISPSYLAFIAPTTAPTLCACLSLVHDTELHYSEFPISITLFDQSIPVSSQKLTWFPFFLFLTTILYLLPLSYFVNVSLFLVCSLSLCPHLTCVLSGELAKSCMNLFSSYCLSAPVIVPASPFPCIRSFPVLVIVSAYAFHSVTRIFPPQEPYSHS